MENKKLVLDFIKPKNLVVTIIFTVFPLTWIFGLIYLLFTYLPCRIRAGKCVAALEAKGELDKAASELANANKETFMKGNVVLTDNYLFCKKTGVVIPCKDILWTYKFRQTTSLLFIPLVVRDSLYVATKTMKPFAAFTMGKDKTEQVVGAIMGIYKRNNSCLVGFTNENSKSYKALRK